MNDNSPVSSQAPYAVALPEPRTLGQLLDHSFKITLTAFRLALPFYLVQALLLVVVDSAKANQNIGLMASATVCQMLLAIYIWLAMTFVAGDCWLGIPTTVNAGGKRISMRLIGRLCLASIVMVVATMLWSILLLIPGIIYMVNRTLTGYIIYFEGATAAEALRKSKELMTQGRWYSPEAPLLRVMGIHTLVLILSVLGGAAAGSTEILLGLGSIDKIAALGLRFIAHMVTGALSLFSIVVYVGFYFDIRARYEGSDLVSSIAQLGASEAAA